MSGVGGHGSVAEQMEDASPVCHPSMPQADEYARWGLGGGLDAPRSEATGRGGTRYHPAARMQGAAVLAPRSGWMGSEGGWMEGEGERVSEGVSG